MTPTPRFHGFHLSRRTARALGAGLCLTTAFALSACGGDPIPITSAKTADSSATASASPSTTPRPTRTPSASATPSASPTPWTAPSLKFYSEDDSVWYQDDSVVHTDSVTDQGNIEGYRTYNGSCLGHVTRDISELIHNISLSDDIMSGSKVNVTNTSITDVNETSRETLDLVHDDSGTMDGYSITWTGVYTAQGAAPEDVEGYKFARTVNDAGLDFSVMVMCLKGSSISYDQWRTILSGIRIEGLTAGKMS